MPTPIDARQGFSAWMDRVRSNAYDADPHLASILGHHGREDTAALRAFGGLVSDRIDTLARETNRDENLPRLRRWNGIGQRVEEVDFHPGYHEIGRLAYATGAMSLYREPGHEVETLARLYLLAQDGEAGHACPFACTAGMIKILQMAPDPRWPSVLATGGRPAGSPERAPTAGSPANVGPVGAAVPPEWLERLLDPDYDTHFHAAQFLTEVQGGSDVGANALVAHDNGDGTWALSGEKWFCSVADAHLFLVTARPEGAPDGTRGVMAFAVPRHVDGQLNKFGLRRLKYKLGTRSMASSEIDFEGARAWPVGDFRRVVEVVLNTSRLYNAVCSCASLQRSFREAHAYASTRMAFGQPILAFPALARTVAKLRTEAYAARGLTFALAAAADRIATGKSDPAEQGAWRMLVNLNKYWTSIAGTYGVKDAIEVLGGNGAIEEFSVLPRLLRDAIVCEAWEGGHNVLCAQALRDSARLRLHEPMFAWLEALSGPHPRLDAVKARWERLLTMPEALATAHVRDVADELRPIAQALALRAEMKSPAHDPLLADVIDHLLTTTVRGWDPLEDAGLQARVQRLVG